MPALRFEAGAQEVFDAWRDELERRLQSEEMAPALEAHVAKYRSLMPSLALLFELIDTECLPVSVRKTAALRAVAWCEYLETHAGRLYASAEKPAMEGARALLERIRKRDVKDGSSARDIYRGRHWSKLSTPEEVTTAAAVLEDYGWLRAEKVETGGRPTTRIRLHPILRGRVNLPYILGKEGAKGAKSPPHTFRTFRTPAALGIQENCATGSGALYER